MRQTHRMRDEGDDLIPWHEAATVVQYVACTNPTEIVTTILHQGSLREVVQKLRASLPDRFLNLQISLPDRGTRPFHFDGYAVKALLEREPPQ